MWNLLQCKTIANTVPVSFIKEAYRKHHQQMQSQAPEIHSELVNHLKAFIKPFLCETKRVFQLNTKIPTNHATYSSKRSEGGLRNDLEGRITSSLFRHDYSGRIDPIVIHLNGPPGCGKSRSVETICKMIGKSFGFNADFRDFTYYRSAGVKHWDGYRNQLITVIDDFGFEATKKGEAPPPSMSEIIQLCSDCDYIVPMAHLSEKGKKFTSKFLIITTNNYDYFGVNFCDGAALYRRISPAYKFENQDGKFIKNEYTFPQQMSASKDLRYGTELRLTKCDVSFEYIVQKALLLFDYRSESKIGECHIIQVPTDTTPGLALNWIVPEELEENRVMTCAIPEPLKVRMITKPQPLSYYLKPLQLAMFQALKKWKCFEPCWNPDYDLTQLGKLDPNKFLLSGDYTAATDELNFNVSQVVVQGLMETFDAYPNLRRLIEWEGGNHLVSYPTVHGQTLEDVVQTNGQLMGSLLSFPILCILNAWTLCTATETTLDTVPGLFHGDDIAAQASLEQINKWKFLSGLIGLQLSQGKNYISKDFISIDSQLFLNRQGELRKEVTGKFKLVKRSDGNVTTCKDALKHGFTVEQIRKYNSDGLKNTIQSLDISYEFGGLGLTTNPNYKIRPLDEAIYWVLSQNKIRTRPFGKDCLIMEKSRANLLNHRILQREVSLEQPELSDQDLKRKAFRALKRVPRDLLTRHFRSGRPLSCLTTVLVHCGEKSRSLEKFGDVFKSKPLNKIGSMCKICKRLTRCSCSLKMSKLTM